MTNMWSKTIYILNWFKKCWSAEGSQTPEPSTFSYLPSRCDLAECGWDLAEFFKFRGRTPLYLISISRDVAEWLERLRDIARDATVPGSIPCFSETVASEGQQMKHCWKSQIITIFAVLFLRPVRNAFVAGSIHYLGKWEGVGPWKSRICWALWNGIELIGECNLGPKNLPYVCVHTSYLRVPEIYQGVWGA